MSRTLEDINHNLRILINSYFEGKKTIVSKEFTLQVYRMIHEGQSDFQQSVPKQFEKLRIISIKKSCGKSIQPGELAFTCLDCGIDRDSHLYCEQCFEGSNHKNHRIKYSTDYAGTCDCGDFQAILPQGCCLLHGNMQLQQQSNNQQLDTNIIIDDQNEANPLDQNRSLLIQQSVPQDFLEHLEQVIITLIMVIVERAEEIHFKGEQNIGKQANQQQDLFNNFIYTTFEMINHFVQDSPLMCKIIGNVLQKKINEIKIQNGAKKLQHDCNNINTNNPLKFSGKSLTFIDKIDKQINKQSNTNISMQNINQNSTCIHQQLQNCQSCIILQQENANSPLKKNRSESPLKLEQQSPMSVQTATKDIHTQQKLISQQNPQQQSPQQNNQQQQNQVTICCCSLIENLFRHAARFDKLSSSMIEKVFCMIMKNDQQFQRVLILAYAKMFKFLIYFTENPPGIYCSGLFTLYAQFFTIQSGNIWLKEGINYQAHVFQKTKEAIECYYQSGSMSRNAYNVFMSLKQLYLFWLKKPHLAQLIDLPKIIQATVEFVFLTQKKNSPELQDDIEKCRLHIECSLILIVKEIVTLIYQLYDQNSAQRVSLIIYTLQCMLSELRQVDLNKDIDEKKEWPIHYTGLRAMSIIMNTLVLERGQESLKQLLLNEFENQLQFETFIQQVIKCSLRSMRFSRLNEQKVGSFYELCAEPEKSMKIEIINSFYKKSYYGQFDFDLALIQILFSILEERKSSVSIMTLLASTYGGIDIKKIYFQTQDEYYKKSLASILEFVVVLAIDGAAFMNSIACTKILGRKSNQKRNQQYQSNSSQQPGADKNHLQQQSKQQKNVDMELEFQQVQKINEEDANLYAPEWLEMILQNVLVNAFHIQKVHDLRTLKEVLFDKILNYDIDIDEFVGRVAQLVKGSTNLHLNTEFQHIYEPYIFHKYQRVTSELYETIKGITNKQPDCDLLLGTMQTKPGFFFHTDSFQHRVLNNIFSDEVPRYLMLCLRIDAFSEKLNDIVKHAIKLIGLYLAFCAREIERGAFSEDRAIFDSLLKYYLKPDMEKKIEELCKNKNMLEIVPTLEKIHKMMEQLRNKILEISNSVKNQEKLGKLSKPGSNSSSAEKNKSEIDKQGNGMDLEEDEDKRKKNLLLKKEQQLKKKQEKIRKEFLEKQKLFLKKNQSVFAEQLAMEEEEKALANNGIAIQKKESNNDEICNICHDKLSGQRYGVYAYMSKDNLIEYCSPSSNFLSFRGLHHNHQTNKNNSSNQFLQINNNQAISIQEWGYNVQSCNHFVHKECNDNILQKNLKTILQNRELFANPYEVLCGHCKFLANIFVYFIDEMVESTYFKDLNKISIENLDINIFEKIINNTIGRKGLKVSHQWEIQKAKLNQQQQLEKDQDKNLQQSPQKQQPTNQAVNNNNNQQQNITNQNQQTQKQSGLETNPQNIVYLLFDQILKVQTMYEQNINMDKNKSEEWILITCDKILTYSSHNVALSGISYFFKKSIHLYRNFYLNFREYFWLFESQHKEEYILKYKQEIIQYTHDILLFEPSIQFNLINNIIQNNQNNKFCLSEIEKKYQNVVWRCAIILKDDEQTLMQIICWLTRRVFRAMIALHFSAYTNKKDPSILVIQADQQLLKLNQMKQISNIPQSPKNNEYKNIIPLQIFKIALEQEEFKYELVNYILPFCRKAVAILLTIFYTKKKDLEEIDMDQFGSDFDEFDVYVNLLDSVSNYKVFHLTLEDDQDKIIDQQQKLLQQSPQLNSKQPPTTINNQDQISINQVLSLQSQEQQTKYILSLYRSGFQNFTIVVLPQDYLEFHKNYNLFFCDFCKNFPRTGDPYLCLVCEKVMCSVKCDKIDPSEILSDQEDDDNDQNLYFEEQQDSIINRDNSSIYSSSLSNDEYDESVNSSNYQVRKKMKISKKHGKRKKGNLNKHAQEKHMGKAAFLHLHSALIVLANYPKLISYGHVYTDKFGQLPNPKNLEWSNYKLNYKLHNRVQDLIISQRIPQEICYRLMKDTCCLFQRDYV